MDAILDFSGVLDLLPLISADTLVLLINNMDTSHSVLVLLLGTEKGG